MFCCRRSGLRVRSRCYALGRGQVQPVAQSEAGAASQNEAAAAGDGEENADGETDHRHG